VQRDVAQSPAMMALASCSSWLRLANNIHILHGFNWNGKNSVPDSVPTLCSAKARNDEVKRFHGEALSGLLNSALDNHTPRARNSYLVLPECR
jgi:hypothetical protein